MICYIWARLWFSCEYSKNSWLQVWCGNSLYTTVRRYGCVNTYETTTVSLKALFCAELLPSLTDSNLSLTAEPKPPLIILKHHFKTSNKGTLSCFIESVLYYCIKSSLYYVEYYEREMDWYSIHSSAQSHIHNKSLVSTVEVSLLSVGSWALNSRWCPGAHIPKNVEAHFQIDILLTNCTL